MTDDLIGKSLGKYRIIEEIGRGGMGVVYKALNTRTNTTVAIKALPPELTHSPSLVRRFQQEAQALSSLHHPNIVRLIETFEEQDTHFIVMEYVEGQTLSHILQKGPLPTEKAKAIALQICAALSHAHQQGIIHRDIKPSNIMISLDERVKVTDFGIARVIDSTLGTLTGTTMGTAEYMSPEQVRGEKADARSDIYSLGVVLYQMLTGRVPFTSDNRFAIGYMHLHQKPVSPRKVTPKVPGGLEEIVLHALEKRKKQRYQAATDLARDLQQGLLSPQEGARAKMVLKPGAEAVARRKTVARALPVAKIELKRLSVPVMAITVLTLVVVGVIARATVLPSASTTPTTVGAESQSVLPTITESVQEPPGTTIVAAEEPLPIAIFGALPQPQSILAPLLGKEPTYEIYLTQADFANVPATMPVYRVKEFTKAEILSRLAGTVADLGFRGAPAEEQRNDTSYLIWREGENYLSVHISSGQLGFSGKSSLTQAQGLSPVQVRDLAQEKLVAWGLLPATVEAGAIEGFGIAGLELIPIDNLDQAMVFAITFNPRFDNYPLIGLGTARNLVETKIDKDGNLISLRFHLHQVERKMVAIYPVKSLQHTLKGIEEGELRLIEVVTADGEWLRSGGLPEEILEVQIDGLSITYYESDEGGPQTQDYYQPVFPLEGNVTLKDGESLQASLLLPAVSSEYLESGGSPTQPQGHIAFVSERDGNDEIYVMDADGNNQTRLTTNSAGDWTPALSPDSTRIAFASGRDGKNLQIYVMDANGNNQTRLTTIDTYDSHPAWSPDGRHIVFRSLRDRNEDIYVMDASGYNQIRLTSNGAYDWNPAWSPDGSRIAFDSLRDASFEIYVMDANGNNQVRLTTNSADDWDPTWSPDGSRIAFVSDRNGNWEIYVMDIDGSNQTRLTRNGTYDSGPAWSPDGQWIAFTSNRDGNDEIYIMRANGSSVTRLTFNEADDYGPSWGP